MRIEQRGQTAEPAPEGMDEAPLQTSDFIAHRIRAGKQPPSFRTTHQILKKERHSRRKNQSGDEKTKPTTVKASIDRKSGIESANAHVQRPHLAPSTAGTQDISWHDWQLHEHSH